MNIQFFHVFNDEKLPDHIWKLCLSKLPTPLNEQAIKFIRWQDAQAYALGKLLILKGIREMGYKDVHLNSLYYTPYGRPSINLPLDFNLSHSGKHVACAFSTEGQIGFDLEQLKKVHYEDFKVFFTPDEMHTILHASNSMETFYRFWTVKESVMKADGRGMSLSPQKIQFNADHALVESKCWFLKEINLGQDVMSYLATEKPIDFIQINSLKKEDLTLLS